MRVLLAALRCEKGAWEENLTAHREMLRTAADEGCRLAVFPEMSLSGSLDPRTRPASLGTVDNGPVAALAAATGELGVAAVFGIAERSADGRAHITQLFADGGRVRGMYRKRHLGEGEEAFVPGAVGSRWELDGVRFGVAVCAESGVDYPFDEAAAAGAPFVVFCAAPGLYGRRSDEDGWRRGLSWWESAGLADACRHAARTRTWILLATQAGTTADEDFPGLAAVVGPDGRVVDRLPDWRPGTLVATVPLAG